MDLLGEDEAVDFAEWLVVERTLPFQGYRQYVAFTYIGFNIVGFVVNAWVLYVVAPLFFASAVRVPKSILFYIFSLCISDLMTMIGMLLLIVEIVYGTWKFSSFACTSYLIFDGMNKFVAPIIVFLISRTCYATICLDKKHADRAGSLRYAVVMTALSLVIMLLMLSPVFAYSKVYSFYFGIEVSFNVIACIFSYAIPLCGIIYWYAAVPVFLRRRAVTTLVTSNSHEAAIRRVITTALVLTAIYVLCWTPYWVSIFAYKIWNTTSLERRFVVIISYFIHLLPYVSCAAYPLIFTTLNRGIRSAHAKVVEEQRRRFRSLTGDAALQIRQAVGSGGPSKSPTGTQLSLRSRFSSFLNLSSEDATLKIDEAPRSQSFLGPPSSGAPPWTTHSANEETLQSPTENESETLL